MQHKFDLLTAQHNVCVTSKETEQFVVPFCLFLNVSKPRDLPCRQLQSNNKQTIVMLYLYLVDISLHCRGTDAFFSSYLQPAGHDLTTTSVAQAIGLTLFNTDPITNEFSHSNAV